MTLLAVKDLTKTYGSHTAVKHVSFELTKGKCIALLGPNGAGKTTILRMLAGLLAPSTGSITFSGYKPNQDIRKEIGYLPQYPAFHSWMTGREFLIYSGQLHSLSKKEALERSDLLLKKTGIYEARHKRIHTYSGGMKQRLGIAQAIIHQPKLLMLDEPVSSLDPIGRRDVLTLMEELKENMTILFSTHILSDADEISDELLLLKQGHLLESGPINDLRKKYQTAMIELQFTGDIALYEQKLLELPSVTNVINKRDVLHISVTDVEQARDEVIQKAALELWPITQLTMNHSTLEDLFMKVVTK